MDTATALRYDRVRKTTSSKRNAIIDQETEQNIRLYSNMGGEQIEARLCALDEEWDIERTLELNASLVGLTGIVLAATVNRKWLALPAIVTMFLAQHAIQGWCPPLPLFRSMNIRTRKEIEREKYALLDALQKKHR